MKKMLQNSLIALALSFNLAALACAEHAHQADGNNSPSQKSDYALFLAKANAPGKQMEYLIPNISCMGCAHKIKKTLKPLEGVSEIKVDADTKKLNFQCQGCDLESIKAKLKEIEYPIAENT